MSVIDKKLWDVKKIGGTLFLAAKTSKEAGAGSYRVRGGAPKLLDEGQKELLETADNLALDAEWSGIISVLDMMGDLGYALVTEGVREGVFYLQARPRLPPRPAKALVLPK